MKFHFYIDTSPSAFSMQATDIAEKMTNDNTHIFILRQALDYKDEYKERNNITVINITYSTYTDVIKDILLGLSQSQFPSVYLHFGTSHTENISILLNKTKYPQNKTHLIVYEDDPLSIITRQTLINLTAEKRQHALATYGQHLFDKIYTNKSNLISTNGWNSVVTFCLGKIFDTVYYAYDNTAFNEQGFVIHPQPNLPVVHSLFFHFPEIEKARDFVDDRTLLVIFKSDYSLRDYQENLTNLIAELRANPAYALIDKIMIWGGRKPSHAISTLPLLHISPSIPLFYLKKSGALPKWIAGELCSEMFLMHDSEIILSLPRTEEIPLEQLTGKFTCFDKNKHISLIDNDALLSPDNVRIFRCAASMGDVIFALGALTALKKNTSEKFILIANKLYEDMISACTAVDYFWPLNAVTEGKSKLIEEVGARNKIHIFDKWEHILAPKHMSLAFLDEFCGHWDESDLQPQLNLCHLDTSRVDAFITQHQLLKEKTVLLHPNVGAPNRTWTEQGWNEVANYLITAGWQVVIIGSDKLNNKKRDLITIQNPQAISAVNQFSMLESVYLMNKCALLVACDSGPVALAGMTSISIVAIYSQIAAKNRLPFRNGMQGWNALGIDVGCSTYGACGRLVSTNPQETTGDSFAQWCPKEKSYECMQALSGQTIIEKITTFLQSDKYVCHAV